VAVAAGTTPALFPANDSDSSEYYQLSQILAYVPTGATLSITYGC